MCFSATASFTAGIVLSGIGVASLKSVKEPNQVAFASIPMVFAVQQLAEGILWLSLTNPKWAGLETMATYSFLLIAQIIWPLWLPAAFILFEKEKRRKNIMKIFLVMGMMIAGYFAYCLSTYNVSASIRDHHIFYDLAYPLALVPYAAFFYVFSTAATPLFSSNRKVQLIGFIIGIFYVVVRILFQPNLISVWCFFGTLIAIIIYLVMREYARQEKMSGRNAPVADQNTNRLFS